MNCEIKYGEAGMTNRKGRPQKYADPYLGDGHKLTSTFQEYIVQVSKCFGDPYDDRNDSPRSSLRAVCRKFDISIPKARKLLITAGAYSTVVSRQVAQLSASGKTIQEIVSTTGLSRASVCSYLPYDQYAYNMKQVSRHTEDSRKYRLRKREVDKLRKCILEKEGEDKQLWDTVVAFEEYHFHTLSGLPFQYKVKRNKAGQPTGEITVSRKENSKSLTRSSALLAFHKVLDDMYAINGIASDEILGNDYILPKYKGPKAIGQIFGISYLYSIFGKIGLIDL